MPDVWTVALIFILAGTVKGITGMGLPTISMGLLGLMIAPGDAAALLIVPTTITNIWQFAGGPNRWRILRRLWPMLIGICATMWITAGLLTDKDAAAFATKGLGLALIIYAAISLARIQFHVAARAEPWLSPVIGAATGLIAGATGVFAIPAVPYLQAMGFDKEDLVQALGLSFTVSTLALGASLAGHGAFQTTVGTASLLCTIPALAGMSLGQWIRLRVNPATFRMIFLIGVLVLGVDLVSR